MYMYFSSFLTLENLDDLDILYSNWYGDIAVTQRLIVSRSIAIQSQSAEKWRKGTNLTSKCLRILAVRLETPSNQLILYIYIWSLFFFRLKGENYATVLRH